MAYKTLADDTSVEGAPQRVYRGFDSTRVEYGTFGKRRVLFAVLIEIGEAEEVDQLVFVIHGVGEGCDLKLRSLLDCGRALAFMRFGSFKRLHRSSG